MTKTELKKMTVADVLKTPEFKTNLEKLLNLLWESRETARNKAILRNNRLKAHPIDKIHADGIWETEKFAEEFVKVIDKTSKYSAMARDYIREVGTSAYITTIKKAQDEKPKNKRVRKNKQ